MVAALSLSHFANRTRLGSSRMSGFWGICGFGSWCSGGPGGGVGGVGGEDYLVAPRGGRDHTKGLSTTEWQQDISPRTSCATSTSGDVWLPAKAALTRRAEGTTSTSQWWRSETDKSAVFAGFRFIQDRQTGRPSAFLVNIVPSAAFRIPVALKNQTLPRVTNLNELPSPLEWKTEAKREGGWIFGGKEGVQKHKLW